MGLQHVTDLLRKSSKLVLFFILGHMVPSEVMPGKQVGMNYACYPNSLIGNIPNVYYYTANNPSGATIVKRWSYANIISYLTPPVENAAGLYKGLQQLNELISSYQSLKDTGRNQIVNSIISTAKQCNLDPYGTTR